VHLPYYSLGDDDGTEILVGTVGQDNLGTGYFGRVQDTLDGYRIIWTGTEYSGRVQDNLDGYGWTGAGSHERASLLPIPMIHPSLRHRCSAPDLPKRLCLNGRHSLSSINGGPNAFLKSFFTTYVEEISVKIFSP
jgi:hypothetical protein